MKNFKDFVRESMNNNTSDIFEVGDILFHGTSLSNYLKMKKNNFEVSELYVTTSEYNANEYAWISSDKNEEYEEDIPVLLVLNYELLNGIIIDDIHDDDYTDGEFDLKQDGQYIFKGNIKKAIFHVISLVDKNIIDDYNLIKNGK
jgi:hypothetical protein